MRRIAVFVLAATVLAAQPAPDPAELYRRVRQRVIEEIARLPNFTCVQTITRRTYGAPRRPPKCDQVVGARKAGAPRQPLLQSDRLRIDVAIADTKEVYSWVGAARFDASDLQQLAGSGQTIMGDFGSHLLAVFNDHPSMPFEGQRTIGGRRLFEYSYQTSQERSQYRVRTGFTQVTTSYQGTVLLDPATSDVVRVTTQSAVLPEETGYCQVTKELDYGRHRINAADLLIPLQASSWAVARDGLELESVSDYSNCREYVGESALRFDDPGPSEPPHPSAAVPPAPPPAVPPGLPFDCRILTTIDSDTAAEGDPIEAVLLSPLLDAAGKTLAPAGTRIHGRLMAFNQRAGSATRRASFEIGVQLRSFEWNGVRVPFAAGMVNSAREKDGSVHLSLHPGVGSFIFYDRKLHLAGLEAKWVTATP